MAAVIDIHTGDRISSTGAGQPPRLRLVHGGGAARLDPPASAVPGRGPAAPALRPPASRHSYLLRRALVVAVAAMVVLLAAQAVAAAGRAVASAAASPPAASGRVHVVRSGETAWGIAGRYAPTMDRRDAVADLVSLNGGGVLRSGQEIRLPASFG